MQNFKRDMSWLGMSKYLPFQCSRTTRTRINWTLGCGFMLHRKCNPRAQKNRPCLWIARWPKLEWTWRVTATGSRGRRRCISRHAIACGSSILSTFHLLDPSLHLPKLVYDFEQVILIPSLNIRGVLTNLSTGLIFPASRLSFPESPPQENRSLSAFTWFALYFLAFRWDESITLVLCASACLQHDTGTISTHIKSLFPPVAWEYCITSLQKRIRGSVELSWSVIHSKHHSWKFNLSGSGMSIPSRSSLSAHKFTSRTDW